MCSSDLAYSKMALYNVLLPSELPDDPVLTPDLESYFPKELRKRFKTEIGRHKLKREIIATVVTNAMVNRVGPGFTATLADKTGCAWPEVARAYLIARDAFALGPMWEAVQALDLRVPAEVQTRMHQTIRRLSERVSLWFLNNGKHPLSISAALAEYRAGARPHPTMKTQARSMSEQDARDIAAYFATTTPVTSAGQPKGTPPAAAATCVACHGADGVGITPDYPTLAGQHADYIEQSLKAYRKGTRQNAIMNGMAAALSDDDIHALAHYFSQQAPSLWVPKAPH